MLFASVALNDDYQTLSKDIFQS